MTWLAGQCLIASKPVVQKLSAWPHDMYDGRFQDRLGSLSGPPALAGHRGTWRPSRGVPTWGARSR